MNSLTHKIDKTLRVHTLDKKDVVVLESLKCLPGLCTYKPYIRIPSEEWASFWILFVCLLAEVDEETLQAVKHEIELGI